MLHNIPDHIRDFIARRETMSLATKGRQRPWNTPVFYFCDDNLRLHFVSDPGTRHIRNMEHCDRVAVGIFDQHQSWDAIRGIQLEGQLQEVAESERITFQEKYCRRFPFLSADARQSAVENGSLMRERFLAAGYYLVKPHFIRFVDNTRDFGFKEEYIIEPR